MPTKIEISHKTIIFIVIFLAIIWLFLQIRDILFLLFISFVVTSALRPFVERLERFRIPRIISILFVYLIVFAFVGFVLSSLIPVLTEQTSRFISTFPRFLSMINPYFDIDIKSITSQIAPISENVVRVTVGVFSNVITILTILVFTFYLLLERKHLEKYIRSFLDEKTSQLTISTIKSVEQSLGAWLRGQLLLMLLVGLLTYGGLVFLRIDFALPLAIIAGILEIVPVIGPILAAVPAVLVALTISPFLALATAALYFIVQQIENTIIVPVVMNKAVGLSPLVIITALMIGSSLAGLIGAVLSIPVVVMVRAIFISVFSRDD